MLFTSRIPKFSDFSEPDYLRIVNAIKEEHKIHRKQWEFASIIRTLEIDGKLRPGMSGMGFGVGTEPLPAYFANKGCNILATDQAITNSNAQNWTGSNQLCTSINDLNNRDICSKEDFEVLVSFQNVDMNWIPAGLPKVDFIWSACALEHLGTLHHGLWFITRTLSLLKPGGIAVHTTEYNLSSNDATNDYRPNNIYREKDLKVLYETVTRLGYQMAPLDLSRGNTEADLFVDGGGWPGWNDGKNGPHLNLKIDGFDATSVLLIFWKPQ